MKQDVPFAAYDAQYILIAYLIEMAFCIPKSSSNYPAVSEQFTNINELRCRLRSYCPFMNKETKVIKQIDFQCLTVTVSASEAVTA